MITRSYIALWTSLFQFKKIKFIVRVCLRATTMRWQPMTRRFSSAGNFSCKLNWALIRVGSLLRWAKTILYVNATARCTLIN